MSQTVRKFWSPRNGTNSMNFNWDAINADSVVLVTAAEYNPNNDKRFVGGATVTVHGIAPHGPPTDPNHGVGFMLEVAWPNPIPICTDITVLDTSIVEVQH